MNTREYQGRSYTPRVIDSLLASLLGIAGAVIIEGPRACGKTMSALHAAHSAALLDDPDIQQLAELAPQAVLEGPRPRLLDEWQLAPHLWNQVRRHVDAAPTPGSFILTGSSVPADDITRHTGAGRFLRLRQRTMTWSESGRSQATVSLGAILAGQPIHTTIETSPYSEVISSLLRTGFPALTELGPEDTATALRGYLQDVVRTDLGRLADVRHEPSVLHALIRALARSVASDVSWQTLRKDLLPLAPAITADTISRYVDLLERLFIVERIPAWSPRLRSRARLRTAPKVHLADPALAAAALDADAHGLHADPRTTGFLFESAVIHDLLVFTEALGGQVHHYRDSNGHEIDAVLTFPGGRWIAVEIKLGTSQIPAGANSLATAVQQINTDAINPPLARLVITGTGPTLTLPDGTLTCPLAALGA